MRGTGCRIKEGRLAIGVGFSECLCLSGRVAAVISRGGSGGIRDLIENDDPEANDMNAIHREQLIHQLNWRYATKQFDPQRKICAEDWAALEDALVLTPSSFGLQPWKFVVVKDPAVREKLMPASWGQKQITDASHLVVFAIKTNLTEKDAEAYIEWIVKVRGVPGEALGMLKEMLIGSVIRGMDENGRREWAQKQVYIALGNFLTSAALLGIDACPMEGIDPAKYDEILGLPAKGLASVVVATAGYRSAGCKYAGMKKVRFPKSEVVTEV
jgi:nitroreductase